MLDAAAHRAIRSAARWDMRSTADSATELATCADARWATELATWWATYLVTRSATYVAMEAILTCVLGHT